MNINALSVLAGCVGLLVGGIGLVAQDIRSTGPRAAPAEPQQVLYAAAWPPHPSVAGVEFHDELLALMSLGPQPRRPDTRAAAARRADDQKAQRTGDVL